MKIQQGREEVKPRAKEMVVSNKGTADLEAVWLRKARLSSRSKNSKTSSSCSGSRIWIYDANLTSEMISVDKADRGRVLRRSLVFTREERFSTTQRQCSSIMGKVMTAMQGLRDSNDLTDLLIMKYGYDYT